MDGGRSSGGGGPAPLSANVWPPAVPPDGVHNVSILCGTHGVPCIENQALFVGELRKYKKVVTEMLTVIKCGESTNLTSQVKDPGGKLISLNQIASNCCIAWQGTVVEVDDVLLTLGLAVKNYSTAKVSQGTLASECDEFNRMFDGCAAEPKRLNVLVVCATKYDKGFSDEFGNRKAMVAPSDAYPNIAQVILLNLSTPDNRAEFFGLNDAPDLASMLEKRIAKGEVEFNNLVQRTSSASAEVE